jgi:hypothetical protein
MIEIRFDKTKDEVALLIWFLVDHSVYRLPCRLFTYPYVFKKTHVYIFPLMREYFDYRQYKPVFRIRFHKLKIQGYSREICEKCQIDR